ncbi:S49 family peptidase [Marinospirillum sp.]|uniref:S49 family peptidase n=1 Tax=Marinospirillum sp. TaxID=2183934 RepID=UPI003A87FD53
MNEESTSSQPAAKPTDPWREQARPTADAATPTAAPEDWMQAWAKEVFLEQRRARRGRIIGYFVRGGFTLLILALVLGVGRGAFQDMKPDAASQPHLAVVEIQGVIDSRGQVRAERILGGLQRAFAADQARAVVLRINSPGGSPVQSGQIYDGLMQLKAEYPQMPVYAVIEDIGASGAYYIAVAADQILADRASLVGSIGVVSGGFGFAEAIERLGIERRVFSAGENKAFLDPFGEISEEQRAFWQQVLDSTHQQFIERVQEGRGERLSDNPQIFSGLVWNGELALQEGLIDELGSIFTLQRQYQTQRLVNYTPDLTPWERLEQRLATRVSLMLNEWQAPSY